ncbi:MAG: Hsp33 family molecular chaperone HslO [Clostridiaceae bacterium]|nr:Hsp33 family molecular chaperone HslO [Clostridiaceae bacterium]
MSDTLLRAITKDAGILMSAAVTTGLAEQARIIHRTLPLATAALGRTLTAAAIMGDQLKSGGSVTIQVRGNGPLGAVTAIGESDGFVRGYLQNPACDLPLRADGKLDVGGGIGQGYLMVIKDIGVKEPVTGTVALVNGEIAEDLTRYFAESEQLPSACALGVLVNTDQSVKQAGGYLVQLMPGVTDSQISRLEENIARAGAMTGLLDRGLTLPEIVRTVLDGFDIELFEERTIGYRCGCSRQKVTRALISLGRTELQKIIDEEERTELTCQFCDKVYHFDREELKVLLASAVRD